jgi:hypothetical protein
MQLNLYVYTFHGVFFLSEGLPKLASEPTFYVLIGVSEHMFPFLIPKSQTGMLGHKFFIESPACSRDNYGPAKKKTIDTCLLFILNVSSTTTNCYVINNRSLNHSHLIYI